MLNLRKFVRTLLGLTACLHTHTAVFAATASNSPKMQVSSITSTKLPEEGFDYRVLPASSVAQQKTAKVEVTEFFWYGCPHCFALEPILAKWVKANQQRIIFKRIPVAFSQIGQYHQKLYFALEQMGKLPVAHDKVFKAYHVAGQSLGTDAQVKQFAVQNKIDATALLANMNGFSMANKLKQINQLVEDKQMDGVPAVMIEQRYLTSPQMVGGREQMLPVLDFLVRKASAERVRK